MMRFFRTYLWDGVRYKGRASQWTFYFHRVTGLGTLIFLAIHILDTSTVYFFPELYADAIGIYRLTIFMLMEIILVFCVLFHGVNGLRLALFDLFPRYWAHRFQNASLRSVFVVSILLWLPAAIIMGQNLIENNFSGG
jgi:succinate dehydrogenase / fumarate reductase cytochrome b subunit